MDIKVSKTAFKHICNAVDRESDMRFVNDGEEKVVSVGGETLVSTHKSGAMIYACSCAIVDREWNQICPHWYCDVCRGEGYKVLYEFDAGYLHHIEIAEPKDILSSAGWSVGRKWL